MTVFEKALVQKMIKEAENKRIGAFGQADCLEREARDLRDGALRSEGSIIALESMKKIIDSEDPPKPESPSKGDPVENKNSDPERDSTIPPLPVGGEEEGGGKGE